MTPHAIYTVSESSLQLVADLSRTRDAKVQIHLAETEDEVARCVAEHGCKTAQYLDRLGLLHERIVLAHCVWLDGDKLELIAERGATIVTNPVSNVKLAVGRAFPYAAAKRAGNAIDTVVVDGRVLMRGREIEGEDEVRDRSAAAARRIRQ